MLTLSIRDKNGEEQVVQYEKEEVTIGRTSASDIVLPRNNISKRHARLVDKDDKVVIVDLRSTNGTYVNGRRITAPEILTPEDKVYIGDFVLRLADPAAAQAAAGPPPMAPPPMAPPMPTGRPTEVADSAAVAAMAHADEEDATRAISAVVDAPPPAPDVVSSAAPPPMAPPAGPPGPPPMAAPAPAAPAAPRVTEGPRVARTVAAIPHEAPAAAPAPAPAAAPEPVVPSAPAASGPAPSAPTTTGEGGLLEAAEAVKRRLLTSIGGERGAANIVRKEKWKGLGTQIARAVEQASAGGEIDGSLDHDQVAAFTMARLVGEGALGELMEDAEVRAVEVNGPEQILVRKGGVTAEPTGRTFPSAFVLERALLTLAREAGLEGDKLPPSFDGRLPSGASLQLLGRDIARQGPVAILRKPAPRAVTPQTLVEEAGLDEATLQALKDAIAERKNLLVVGRPGSGRTTVLNALAYLVPSSERIALIEDVPSISLPHDDVVRLDRDGLDDAGLDITDVLPRLSADRALVDEVSGGEVVDLVATALGGHDGLLVVTTGSSAAKTLEHMALELELFASARLDRSARAMVAAAVDLVLVVARGESGVGKIVEVVEVEGAADAGFRTRAVLAS